MCQFKVTTKKCGLLHTSTTGDDQREWQGEPEIGQGLVLGRGDDDSLKTSKTSSGANSSLGLLQ